MSDNQDNTSDKPVDKPKRGRGRPRIDKTLPTQRTVGQRLVKYTLNAGECIRDNIPFIYILQFHAMRAAGINPKWILNKDYLPIGIEPDPSPLAQSPTSAEKADSLKFITAYGWGQPVQSTQVDVDIRARIDQMGSGISTQELMGMNPRSLKLIGEAFKAQMDYAEGNSDAIDAEFTEVSNQVSETNGETNTNSVPEDNSSTLDDKIS